jgi:hypothetical protein
MVYAAHMPYQEPAKRIRPAHSWKRIPLAGCLLLLLAPVAQAVSIKEYHDQVSRAVTALDSLALIDEDESAFDYSQRSAETVQGVRSVLPKSQTVEWEGTTFTVDNGWLHEELDKLANIQPTEHARAIERIKERLQAVADRLTEAQQPAGSSVDKAEASRKLAAILQRPEYAQKAKGQSFLSRLIERLIKWLQQLFPKPKPMSPGSAGIFSQIAQVLVILLALGVLAYVLKLFLPRLRRTQRAKKKEKKVARIVLGETLRPDQSANDLLAEAEGLARRGDLRAAIRKAYIALLVELGDRKIISLAQHKTNHDYLRAVRDTQPLYGNVKQLTESFERHWYGFASATESDWEVFRSGYRRTLS